MATPVLMPALSPTMTEGTLARWLKKEGEAVKAGDVLAEIETDKATMEVEAVDEGILGRILVPDGTANVKVNAPIAMMLAEGETAPSGDVPVTTAPSVAAAPAAPAAPVPAAAAAASPAPVANGHDAARVFASPLARRMAKQAGIDLSALRGSGPNGRIVRADVEAAQKGGAPAAPTHVAPVAVAPAAAAPAAPAPSAPMAAPAARAPVFTAPHRLVPHSTMRKVIARRLLESHQQTPFYFVSMDVELDALLGLRAQLNAKSPKDGPGTYRLSVNDFVIKAAAATLRRVPELNAAFTEENMVMFDDIDISVAVSIPDGLITPIIRGADRKGLAAISTEMKDKGARAKSGKLKPEEFQGGSFSISNLGMFGTKAFTAIINPPQAAILAVGAGEKRAVVKDDALAVASVMTCTLTIDHRVADGALGAAWLAAFKAIVEDPLSLML